MVKHLIERFFSTVQTIIFIRIGNNFPTNSFKRFMDHLFIIVEKVGSKLQIFSEPYIDMYKEIVEKEIKLGSIGSKDHILIIGSGSIPATAILYAIRTQASVVAIDKDPHAIPAAIEYITRFSLGNRLKIELADGFAYPLDGFNVIVVLYGVKQQSKMIAHLAEHVRGDTRVIIRIITDDKGNILDDQIDPSKYFVMKGQVRSESLGSVTSFLLMKKTVG